MSTDSVTFDTKVASAEDIRAILGALNESDQLKIAALQPKIRDVVDAAIWLSGDRDVFGAGEPVQGTVAQIVEVLTSSEDDVAQHSPV